MPHYSAWEPADLESAQLRIARGLIRELQSLGELPSLGGLRRTGTPWRLSLQQPQGAARERRPGAGLRPATPPPPPGDRRRIGR